MKISVIGAGGWGTALSVILCRNGHKVTLFPYEKEVVDEINLNHSNNVFLPDVQLPKNLKASELPVVDDDNEAVLFAVPTQFIRSILLAYPFDLKDKIVINVAKGIEQKSLLRISQIFQKVAGVNENNYVVITGPSHAEEVVKFTPTAVVAASEDPIAANSVQEMFTNENFRIYTSPDVVGCEIGGAIKNVIAIAAGIIDGLKLGDNTKAALLTRGLAETARLGISLGASHETFSGLSGLGDLFVTCNSRHSRNRFVGEQIGAGKSLAEIIDHMQMVAEGVTTTKSAYFLAQSHGVETPITEQIYKILFEDVKPLDAIKQLMTRSSKREWWW